MPVYANRQSGFPQNEVYGISIPLLAPVVAFKESGSFLIPPKKIRVRKWSECAILIHSPIVQWQNVAFTRRLQGFDSFWDYQFSLIRRYANGSALCHLATNKMDGFCRSEE